MPDSTQSPDTRAVLRVGLISALFAYTFWGLFPLYLKLLDSVPPAEVLAHRILWSVPFGAVILSFRKQWTEVFIALRKPKIIAMLALAATAIAVNWFIYVWAVQVDRVLEASLGYYINPLMYVAVGVIVLGEKLRRLQIIAIALAAMGVLILTFGAGVFPWVSIALAALFTAYGYIRKITNIGAMPGLFIEVLLLSPIAVLYLAWLFHADKAMFLSGDTNLDLLLLLAGPATVVPLVCFALAARRLTLTTLGIMQYVGPTLQFIVGIYFGEAFTLFHGICFGLIWIALAIFSIDASRATKSTKSLDAA